MSNRSPAGFQRGRAVLILTAAWLALPRLAAACATCYGDPDAPMVHGMNNAILVLIGFVGLIYVGFGKIFWDFRKRAKRMARPDLRLINGGKH